MNDHPHADITVCIPTIPTRGELLCRALKSVVEQEVLPSAVNIEYDWNRTGHGPTRTRAARRATTEWLAFLDDDDEMYPQHLSRLHGYAIATGADLVYPWFDVIGGGDPFPSHEKLEEWDPTNPTMFPVTVLVKREAFLDVGGMDYDLNGPENGGSDFQGWLALARAGYSIKYLAQRTWAWHHDSGNTSGMGSRW